MSIHGIHNATQQWEEVKDTSGYPQQIWHTSDGKSHPSEEKARKVQERIDKEGALRQWMYDNLDLPEVATIQDSAVLALTIDGLLKNRKSAIEMLKSLG
jgi:hypothetical protein